MRRMVAEGEERVEAARSVVEVLEGARTQMLRSFVARRGELLRFEEMFGRLTAGAERQGRRKKAATGGRGGASIRRLSKCLRPRRGRENEELWES